MARVNLILCDWCKEDTKEVSNIAIGEVNDPSIFEICIKCRDDIIAKCKEKPNLSTAPKKKPATRSAEEVKKKNTCPHEKVEFFENGGMKCEDCNEAIK